MPRRYRHPDEVKEAWELEPLIRLREYLIAARSLERCR